MCEVVVTRGVKQLMVPVARLPEKESGKAPRIDGFAHEVPLPFTVAGHCIQYWRIAEPVSEYTRKQQHCRHRRHFAVCYASRNSSFISRSSLPYRQREEEPALRIS